MFPGLPGLMKLTKTVNLPHSKDKHVQKWTFWKCLIMLAQSWLCEIRLWGHFNASKHNNWRINRLERLSSGAESNASRRFQTHAETKRLSSACRDCGLFLWEQWRKQNAYTYRHTVWPWRRQHRLKYPGDVNQTQVRLRREQQVNGTQVNHVKIISLETHKLISWN